MSARLSSAFALALKLAFLASLPPLALGGAGCAVDSASEPEAALGALAIPLTTTTGDGTIYRLSSATFEVVGPAGTTVLDGNAAVPSVSVTLPPGLISVLLRPSWVLTRSTDGGVTFTSVDALLGTANPLASRVVADTAVTLSFNFLVRNPDGQLSVSFGVDDSPRQLAGGFRVLSTPAPTGQLAAYANARLDFSTYFSLFRLDRVTEPDGSKSLVYSSTTNATEFFNDAFGVLSGVVGPAFSGGYLQYQITAKTDGSQEVTGTYFGNYAPFPQLLIGPSPVRFPVPLDAQGFPTDGYFQEVVAFTLDLSDAESSTASGTFVLRNLAN